MPVGRNILTRAPRTLVALRRHPSPVATAPSRIDAPEIEGVDELHRPWQVVVWNDPVNLMTYVVYVFRKLFSFPEAKATKLMLAVHQEGRAVVASGPREKCELDCYRLHHYGLWATMEKT